MFGKAKRFEPEKVCGPLPVHRQHTTQNFLTVEWVLPASREMAGLRMVTRNAMSHSSSSVCSGESSTKSHQAKDHTTGNKRIKDLQRELQNMTLERNQLLGKPSLRQSEKESESEATSSEIRTLNQIIKELQGKLGEVKCLEEEKHRLENERDTALNHLETKEEQVDTLNKQIEDFVGNCN